MDQVLGRGQTIFTADASQLIKVSHQAERTVGATMKKIDSTAGQLREKITAGTFALDGFIRTGGGASGVATALSGVAAMFGGLPGLIAGLIGSGLLLWLTNVSREAKEAASSVKSLADATKEAGAARAAGVGARGTAAASGSFSDRLNAIERLQEAFTAAREQRMAAEREAAARNFELITTDPQQTPQFFQTAQARKRAADAAVAEAEQREAEAFRQFQDAFTPLRDSKQFVEGFSAAEKELSRTANDATKSFQTRADAANKLIATYERLIDILRSLSQSPGFFGVLGLNQESSLSQLGEAREALDATRELARDLDKLAKEGATVPKGGRVGVKPPGAAEPGVPRGGTTGLTEAFFSLQANALSSPEMKVVRAIDKSDKQRAQENQKLIGEVRKINTGLR